MDQRDSLHPFPALLDGAQRRGIIEEIGLGVEQADDDLQVVFYTVVHLLEEPFLFFYQLVQGQVLFIDLGLFDLAGPNCCVVCCGSHCTPVPR